MTIKTLAKKEVAKKVVKVPKVAKVKKVVAGKSTKAEVKKPAAKKTTKKAKKILVYADNQSSFWVSNGQILNSLIALRDALDAMDREVYSYHAGEAHNDFANWVAAVLCDDACAADLEKAKTPESAKTVVTKHLKTYTV